MSSQHQKRDRDLETLQGLTDFNIEDCIVLLREYDWKLQALVEDFCKGKQFQTPFTAEAKKADEPERKKDPPSELIASLGTQYTKRATDPKSSTANVDEDHHYALLLQQYGDHDESAWRHRGERQLQPQTRQSPQEEKDTTQPIYHERQQLLRCGIHSLNNLFQIPHLFTHQHLDALVNEFARNGTTTDYGDLYIGDYDLRVLVEAIKRCGYQVRQLNFYNGESLPTQPWDSYFGLLLNINGNHWFTIKNLHGSYYNLDSTFSKPSRIGQKEDLVSYLIRLIYKFRSVYIFIVSQEASLTHGAYSSSNKRRVHLDKPSESGRMLRLLKHCLLFVRQSSIEVAIHRKDVLSVLSRRGSTTIG